MISEEERQIIKETLDHKANGTTHMLDDIMYNPVAKYNNPDQLSAEMNVLFKNFPIIIAHSSDLPEAGSFFTYNDLQAPILVTRNNDGQVKAFLNVCRHRGARVEDKPCGKARTFSCPYHSWTFDLNGNLRGMPQPFGFGDLDKSKLGLVELPVFEEFGMIWVVPSKTDQQIDFDAWTAPMREQLIGLDLGNHVVFKKWSLDRNMSWRLALEGFQESYHFCSAHRDTACSSYLDNQSVHMNFYPHVRHAVPLPSIEELHDIPEEEWEYRPHYMTQNYLFPANFVQVMTDHVYVHTIIPTGEGTCKFQCMMLIPEAPQSEKAQRYWNKNYDLIRIVFDEDFIIGEGIQKGLNTNANQEFLFGMYECGLHFGQTAINDALDGKLTVNTL